jgi:dihydrolipoamide dehydrogenase
MIKKLFIKSILFCLVTNLLYCFEQGYKDTKTKEVVKQFDVIVIGSGSGTKLVRPVANKGLKVAIIEEDQLGGTCLNKGCIPSKMLIHTADIAMKIRRAELFNLHVENWEVHFQELIKRVSAVIDQESQKIEPLYKSHKNITLYRKHAVFLEDHLLQVGEDIITAPKIFITSGVRVNIPSIKGLAHVPYMTYKEALRNPQLPKRLLVIGGGYIAAELGYLYGALGSELHVLVRDKMLSREDSDIQKGFEKAFSRHFHLHSKTQVKEVFYEEGVFRVDYVDEEGQESSIEGDALLVATGMKPQTADLGLEHTSIQVDDQGYILVNDYLETTAKGVYAFGDCIGRYSFRHSANYEGEYLFRELFVHQTQEPISYKPVPHAIFTYPQIASVGKTEDALKQEGKKYIKAIASYQESAMGMALRSEEGFVKLLFDPSSRKLLGAHILGEEASDMIHILIACMNQEATVEDLAEMIYIHPALPEVIRNAARQAKNHL